MQSGRTGRGGDEVSEKLKPCALCGGAGHFYPEVAYTNRPNVECCGCAVCIYGETDEQARDAWNDLATLRAERDAAVEALQAMLDCMVTEATMDGSTHQAGPSVRRGHPWAQAVAKARKALGVK